LFNWLEEKTGIQRASKVRSYNGLLVHVFGRLAAAMWLLLTKAIVQDKNNNLLILLYKNKYTSAI